MLDMERPLVFGIYYCRSAFQGHSKGVFKSRYISPVQCMVQNVCFSQPCMVFNFFGDQMPSMEGASIFILPSEATLQ